MAKYGYGINIAGLIDVKQMKDNLKNEKFQIDIQLTQSSRKVINELKQIAKDISNAFNALGSANIPNIVSGATGGRTTASKPSQTTLDALEEARRIKSKETLISQIVNRINMGDRGKIFDQSNSMYTGSATLKGYEDALQKAKQLDVTTADYKKKLVEAQTEVVKLNPAYQSLQKEAQKTLDKTDSFFQVFSKKLLNAISYRLIFTVFNTIQKGASSLVKTTIDINSELRDINKVLDLTNKQMDSLVNKANDLANKYARTTVEAMKAMEYFAKAGFSFTDTMSLAELSLKLQNVGDLSADMASGFIISSNAAFQLNGNVEKLGKTIDIVNNLANHAAVSVGFLSEAMKVSGAVAYSAGLSMEEFASILTTVGAATQRGGREVGNGIKTILLRLTQVTDAGEDLTEVLSKVEGSLRKVGIETRNTENSFRPAMDTLTELASKWQELTDIEQREITYRLAGVYRSNILEAFLANINEYEKNLYIALNSVGSATKENQLYISSLEAGLKKLTAAWEKFVIKFKASKYIENALKFLAFLVRNLDTAIQALTVVTVVLFANHLRKTLYAVKLASDGFVTLGKSIKAVVSSTQFLSLAITGVVLAIMAIVDASRRAKEAQKRLISDALEKTKELVGQYGQLNILIREYEELHKQMGETGKETERLKDLQEQLNAQFAHQAAGIDLVNGKYDEQIEKIEALRKKKLEEAKEAGANAYMRAYDYLKKDLSISKYGKGLNVLSNTINTKYGLADFSKRTGLGDVTASFSASGGKWGGSISREDFLAYLEWATKEMGEDVRALPEDSGQRKGLLYILGKYEDLLSKHREDIKDSVDVFKEQQTIYKDLAQSITSSDLAKLSGVEKTVFDFVADKTKADSVEEYTDKFSKLVAEIDGVNPDNVEKVWKSVLGILPNLTEDDKYTFLDYVTNLNTQLSNLVDRLNNKLTPLEQVVTKMEKKNNALSNLFDFRRSIADELGLTGDDYINYALNGDMSLLPQGEENAKMRDLAKSMQDDYDKYLQDIENAEKEGLNNQETITKLYETQVALKEKQLKILQKELDIQKKQQELNRLENERTQKVFIGGKAVYTVDHEAVAKAKEDMLKSEQEKNRLESEYQTGVVLADKEQEMIHFADSISELRKVIADPQGLTDAFKELAENTSVLSQGLVGELGEALVDVLEFVKEIKPLKTGNDNKITQEQAGIGRPNINIDKIEVHSPKNFDEFVNELTKRTAYIN